MPLGRGTPPAHTASAGGLKPAKAVALLEKVPDINPSAVHCIARFFCQIVTSSDSKRRLINLASALHRNEELVKRAELAYFQTLDGNNDDMRKLVCMSATDLATPERQLKRITNRKDEMTTKKFSVCFRPVMDDREKHEQQARSVLPTRVGSVSNLGD